MKQTITHGATIDTVTPEEAAKIIEAMNRRDAAQRVRATATIKLDANGNGQDEVYGVPAGYEFGVRRVFLDLDTVGDPIMGGFPFGIPSADAPGDQVRITVAQPAAGAEWSYVTTTWTRFITARATLTTSAVVANRKPRYRVRDGGGVELVRTSETVAIPANTVLPILYSLDAPNASFTGDTSGIVIISPSLWLPPGYTIGSITDLIDAGDQYSAVELIAQQLPYTTGRAVEYLRSGSRIQYAMTQGPSGSLQVPGIESWGEEQGPYLRNGEVFEVRAKNLAPNATLTAIVSGMLSKPVPQR